MVTNSQAVAIGALDPIHADDSGEQNRPQTTRV